VTNKPELRTYHNARGDGKVIGIEFLDAEAGGHSEQCLERR
jgi:replication factor A1